MQGIITQWHLLFTAIQRYGDKYRYVDVPYIIPNDYAVINVDDEHRKKKQLTHVSRSGEFSGAYVGSAEQSFVYGLMAGNCPWGAPGNWMSLTTCVRAEPNVDDLHQEVFSKLELLSLFPTDVDFIDVHHQLHAMLRDATVIFREMLMAVNAPPNIRLELIIVPDDASIHSMDIVLSNGNAEIEIGSYGIRELPSSVSDISSWYVYGTGIAEPRFSAAVRKLSGG